MANGDEVASKVQTPSVMEKISIRFMSVEGRFRIVRTEMFVSETAAMEAVTAYAHSVGHTNVKVKLDAEDDGIRYTATTPGGRAGRNIAFGDVE